MVIILASLVGFLFLGAALKPSGFASVLVGMFSLGLVATLWLVGRS
ncbi:MAG TPA: hypothetical protein VG845_03300 [Dehalococcoidia bacterium]|nr:hypothetical protein [Dehalococcoidia bacterium]